MRRRKCQAPDCTKSFTQQRIGQRVCSASCGIASAQYDRVKEADRAHRKRKKALKPISKHLAETQTVFNAFIRKRDELLPCVSCGRFHEGQWHAGHFQPRSTHSRIRFSEFNCARQCAPCNNHKSGNLILFREELCRRISEKMVVWLEAPEQREPKKWTIEECDELKEYYRFQLKDLEAVSVLSSPF